MKKKVIKILNVVVDIIVVMILIMSVFVLAISLSSNTGGVPNIFGKAPMRVLSDSMKPTFNQHDLIFSDVVEDSNAEYEVGEIVTFEQSIDGVNELNTHRIVAIVNQDGDPCKKGDIKFYQTKGDNNAEPDAELKTAADIKAVYHGFKIPWIGYLRTQEGFFIFVLIPMIIFFLYEAVRVVINIVGYNKEKALLAAQEVINNSDLTEEQKQKAIQEYLAAQQAKESKEEKSSDEPEPAQADSAEAPAEEPNDESSPDPDDVALNAEDE